MQVKYFAEIVTILVVIFICSVAVQAASLSLPYGSSEKRRFASDILLSVQVVESFLESSYDWSSGEEYSAGALQGFGKFYEYEYEMTGYIQEMPKNRKMLEAKTFKLFWGRIQPTFSIEVEPFREFIPQFAAILYLRNGSEEKLSNLRLVMEVSGQQKENGFVWYPSRMVSQKLITIPSNKMVRIEIVQNFLQAYLAQKLESAKISELAKKIESAQNLDFGQIADLRRELYRHRDWVINIYFYNEALVTKRYRLNK